MNCYVFEYEGLEWEGISYVSKANGEEYGLRTQALFSLNQNCYCVDACTELEGERAGIIKVFQVSGGEFKFMFGLWSDKIFPQTVCWKDNTTLYVKALRSDGDVPVLIVSACACSMMIRFLDIVVFNPPLQTVYINLSVHGGFSGNSVLKNGL